MNNTPSYNAVIAFRVWFETRYQPAGDASIVGQVNSACTRRLQPWPKLSAFLPCGVAHSRICFVTLNYKQPINQPRKLGRKIGSRPPGSRRLRHLLIIYLIVGPDLADDDVILPRSRPGSQNFTAYISPQQTRTLRQRFISDITRKSVNALRLAIEM